MSLSPIQANPVPIPLRRCRCRVSHWIATLLLAWLTFQPIRLDAMMSERISGKSFKGPGGSYGYQRRDVFWSDIGDMRSHHLMLGPVEVVHYAKKTDPVQYASPARLSLRIGTRAWLTTLDSTKQTGFWIGLTLVTAAFLGLWRKRRIDRGKDLEAPKPIPR